MTVAVDGCHLGQLEAVWLLEEASCSDEKIVDIDHTDCGSKVAKVPEEQKILTLKAESTRDVTFVNDDRKLKNWSGTVIDVLSENMG